MLTYQKIYENNNILRYEFYPEDNKSTPGIVEFICGVGKIIQHSESDFNAFYAIHALKIDLATDSGTIAWY